MHVWQSIASLENIPGPVVLALGVFDGLHLGHQAVLSAARALAVKQGGTAVMATFSPHPLRVLRPDISPLLMTSLEHKKRLLQGLGIEHLLVIPFTAEFGDQDPEQFLEDLRRSARPLGGIVTGTDYCFGKQRRGTVQMLAEYGALHGIEVCSISAVMLGGERISSTRLRRAVMDGDFGLAAQLLGRPHSVLGTVMSGKQLGRTLGFPTANLHVHSEQLPPPGVYAVRVRIEDTPFAGMANLGVRPTVQSDGQPVLEVHILDFNQMLYGQDIEIEFVQFLRAEQKFSGIEALKAQLEADRDQARALLLSAPSV